MSTDSVEGRAAVGGEIRTGGFALPVPAGWEDRTVPTLTGPTVAGVSMNIVVTRERLCDHMGLGAFASGWVHRLREEVPVRELRPPWDTVTAGVRSQVRTLGWSGGGVDVVQLVALFVAGEHGYAVVGTAAGSALSELDEGFRSTLEGLRLDVAQVPV